jgi:hypothetical protein
MAISNPGKWQEKSRAFVGWCAKRLWTQGGIPTVKHLEKLGFDEAILREARIGWNPDKVFRGRVEWGLAPEMGRNMKPKKLCLPSGIVIPTFDESELKCVRVWEYGVKDRPWALDGSTPALTIAGELQGAKGILVFEPELLAHRARKELGVKGISAIGLGDMESPPDAGLFEALSSAEHLVLAVEKKHSWARLADIIPGAMRMEPPLLLDFDLKAWARAALPGLGLTSIPSRQEPGERTRWDELAESGQTDLDAGQLEDAIFLFALEKVRGGQSPRDAWEAFAGHWARVLPEEAFMKVEAAYLGLEAGEAAPTP